MKFKKNIEKSRKKYPRWIFYIFSISLPFLFIIIFEIILRLINAGTSTSLFIKSNRINGYLVMNPDVSRRYFVQQNATRGFLEEFSEVKKDNTVRIFVMGESTAVGFPYLNNVSFHRMIKYRLEHEFPDLNFEIINLGLTAICSYSLLDLAPEVIKQKPDAIIIYAGHNEYVGALGIGASSLYNYNRKITQLIIAFRKLRITQLLEGFMQKITSSDEFLEGKNLMQRMAEKQQIEYGSKAYYAGLRQFSVNMSKLLSLFRETEIPVFISELIANEKDLPPFISISAQNVSSAEIEALMENAEIEIEADRSRNGMVLLKKAESLDSLHAGIQYLLGRTYFNLQKYDSARFHFIRAKDYDMLRFRAPEEFNMIIKKIAHEQGAYFIPLKATFENLSFGSIIGNELITEHVHPNINGYFLLANTIYDSLLSSPLLQNKTRTPLDDDAFRLEMPVTLMDSLYGDYNVAMLKKGWPFFQDDNITLTHHDNLQANLTNQVLQNKKSWIEAFDEVYIEAIKKNDHQTALRIAESLHLEFPYDIRFLENSARHSMVLGLFKKGAHYFKKAFELTSLSEYAKEAMIAYLKCDEPENALRFIPALLAIKNEGKLYQGMHAMIQEIINYKSILKNTDYQVDPMILIARNYYMMGNFKVAEHYALEALELDPSNADANLLVEHILKQKTLQR